MPKKLTVKEKPIVHTLAEAKLSKAMFGEYPALFQAGAGGSCPAGYHSVTNSKGTTFCRKSRGSKMQVKQGKDKPAKKAESKKTDQRKYKPSKAPAGIQAKRRKEKNLYLEGVSELKGEKNQQKRFNLIKSFDMDKINAMISRMKLQSDGSKTKKIDRIMSELDKKLKKEHRYFDE